MRMDQVLRSGLFASVVALLIGAPAIAQVEADDSGPTTEGIEVHGHWIIEVYEDDTVVERREFQNALVPGADSILASVLAGEQALEQWLVDLNLQNFDDGFADVRLSTDGAFGTIGGLTITTPNDGDNAGSIVFDWSGTPWSDPLDTGEDGQLVGVQTTIFTTEVAAAFTRKDLTSPVAIAEGQTVNITVIISFTG